MVLSALMEDLDGDLVADAYSEDGVALMTGLGWTRERDAEHPVFVFRRR
jgi:hypothetical protein